MTFAGWRKVIAVGAGLAAALCLSACGRNGPLELPPGPAAAPPALVSAPPPLPGTPGDPSQEAAAKTGFDIRGNPVAGPPQGRAFILDPLLD